MGSRDLFCCMGHIGRVLDHDHVLFYLLDCFFAVSFILLVFDGLIQKG